MASVYVISGVASQLSVAVAVPRAAGVIGSSQLTVTAAGHVITGAVTSTTVMTWLQVLALPQLSVAVHVRVMTTEHGVVLFVASAYVITGVASQLSVAVALPRANGVIGSSQFTVTSAGQRITGAVTSTTVITWLQVLALPQLSVAVHVRVMTTEHGFVLFVASAYVITGVASQLSVAVALPRANGVIGSSQFTVTSAGQRITGAVTSTTVITWLQVLALPQLSVAVHVRVMTTEHGFVLFVASAYVITGVASQLSVAVALPRANGVIGSSQFTVTSAGQRITGAVTSTTVITWLQVLALPQLSVAVHVRVMTTEHGFVLFVASAYVITGVASQLSVAVALPRANGVIGSSQFTVTSAGQRITGAVTSTTVITWLQVLALPQLSVAVHVRVMTTEHGFVLFVASAYVITGVASQLSVAVALPRANGVIGSSQFTVTSAGQRITGAVTSTTVITWLQVLALPQLSVAVHVRVMTTEHGFVLFVASAYVITGVASQLSVAVALPRANGVIGSSQFTVTSAGQRITGAVTSTTVITWLQVLALPQLSVAVHVRVMTTEHGFVLFVASAYVITGVASQLSVAVALPRANGVIGSSQFTVTSAGQRITGAVTSTTVITWLQVLALPQLSVAVHVRVMTTEHGFVLFVASAYVITGVASQLSVAVALPRANGVIGSSQFTVTSAGQRITGAVTSTTVITWLQVLALPQLSVAVHVRVMTTEHGFVLFVASAYVITGVASQLSVAVALPRANGVIGSSQFTVTSAGQRITGAVTSTTVITWLQVLALPQLSVAVHVRVMTTEHGFVLFVASAYVITGVASQLSVAVALPRANGVIGSSQFTVTSAGQRITGAVTSTTVITWLQVLALPQLSVAVHVRVMTTEHGFVLFVASAYVITGVASQLSVAVALPRANGVIGSSQFTVTSAGQRITGAVTSTTVITWLQVLALPQLSVAVHVRVMTTEHGFVLFVASAYVITGVASQLSVAVALPRANGVIGSSQFTVTSAGQRITGAVTSTTVITWLQVLALPQLSVAVHVRVMTTEHGFVLFVASAYVITGVASQLSVAVALPRANGVIGSSQFTVTSAGQRITGAVTSTTVITWLQVLALPQLSVAVHVRVMTTEHGFVLFVASAYVITGVASQLSVAVALPRANGVIGSSQFTVTSAGQRITGAVTSTTVITWLQVLALPQLSVAVHVRVMTTEHGFVLFVASAYVITGVASQLSVAVALPRANGVIGSSQFTVTSAGQRITGAVTSTTVITWLQVLALPQLSVAVHVRVMTTEHGFVLFVASAYVITGVASQLSVAVALPRANGVIGSSQFTVTSAGQRITGAVTSTTVITWLQVLALPQLSVAVHVRVMTTEHGFVLFVASAYVITGVASQLSVAVALPRANGVIGSSQFTVTSAGQRITGAVTSTTVITWLQVLALPQLSVAVHVRVMTTEHGFVLFVASAYVITGVASQLSVAVALPRANGVIGSSQFTVTSAGQRITGAVTSTTVITWLQVLALPQLSVAVHVRVMTTEHGFVLFVASAYVITGVASQLSVAVALPRANGVIGSSQFTVTSAGQRITGAVTSTTVITWLQVLALPQLSVAVHVRVMTTEHGFVLFVASAYVITGVASQLSVAVALPRANGVIGSSQFTVTSAGQRITGAVTSTTVITWLQVLALPQLSVAVHVRVMTTEHGFVLFVASAYVITGVASQLSVAVALPRANGVIGSSQFTVTSAGQRITGAVTSTTVITWLQVLALPHLSVAGHVRVMTTVDGFALFLASAYVILGVASQLSVAVALPRANGVIGSSQFTVTSAGQRITGAVTSTTVITWLQVLALPQLSVAVHVRVMTTEHGFVLFVASAYVITGVASQLSVAVALPRANGVIGSSQFTVTSAGQRITGAVTSTTVIFWLQVAASEMFSVSVHVAVMITEHGFVLFVASAYVI